MEIYHNVEGVTCDQCKNKFEDPEQLQKHMIEVHPGIVMFHTMAQQIDQVHDKIDDFSSIISMLKTIIEKQNIMEQELFVIRNNQKTIIPVPTTSPTVAPLITPPAQTISSPDVQQGSNASKPAKNAKNVKKPEVMKENTKDKSTDSKILFNGF